MKKKGILILLVCFSLNYIFAQQITIKYIESRLVTHQGIEFIGELKDKKNDLYSYTNWDNKGVIFVDNKRYYLSNLNFNVTTNSFDSRIKREKYFSYKSSEIDSVTINNHMFKKVSNSFYEVLFETENNLFLKKYDIKYKAGSVSRLDGSIGKSTTALIYKYLIKSDDSIKMISLNKRSILDLLESDFDKENLETYVKTENLSYKKEEDTIKIFEFILKNSKILI
jgi:hypothetical protein